MNDLSVDLIIILFTRAQVVAVAPWKAIHSHGGRLRICNGLLSGLMRSHYDASACLHFLVGPMQHVDGALACVMEVHDRYCDVDDDVKKVEFLQQAAACWRFRGPIAAA
jgi:hypothetical protein